MASANGRSKLIHNDCGCMAMKIEIRTGTNYDASNATNSDEENDVLKWKITEVPKFVLVTGSLKDEGH